MLEHRSVDLACVAISSMFVNVSDQNYIVLISSLLASLELGIGIVLLSSSIHGLFIEDDEDLHQGTVELLN